MDGAMPDLQEEKEQMINSNVSSLTLFRYIDHTVDVIFELQQKSSQHVAAVSYAEYSNSKDKSNLNSNQIEYLISKSVAEAPEDYEDLLRKYETDIRAHYDNKHYLEIQIILF